MILLCRSLTYAQHTVEVLREAGIPTGMLRKPAELEDSGCGYCVRIPVKRVREALDAIRREKLPVGKLYRRTADARYEEYLL